MNAISRIDELDRSPDRHSRIDRTDDVRLWVATLVRLKIVLRLPNSPQSLLKIPVPLPICRWGLALVHSECLSADTANKTRKWSLPRPICAPRRNTMKFRPLGDRVVVRRVKE